MLEYAISVLQIIAIDIVLSGDNAVVIAMAAHKLPAYQRQRAIMWGGGIAIFLRIVFTLIMAFLLMVPLVRLVGGLFLAYIACKLLRDEEEEHVTPDNADASALQAIKMIFLADFVMSLDNMLAVAGASHGNWGMLLMGLGVSIGIIMTCSNLIARLMNRFHWIVYVGTAILAFTAGEMIAGDRELAGWVMGNHKVVLNGEWKERFLTHGHFHAFDESKLPADVQKVVEKHAGRVEYIGQMSAAHKEALLAAVSSEDDRHAVEQMYETAKPQAVPSWVPAFLHSRAERWVQSKWPAAEWEAVKDHQYPWASWILYVAVVGLCMLSPKWWPERAVEPQPAPSADPHTSEQKPSG